MKKVTNLYELGVPVWLWNTTSNAYLIQVCKQMSDTCQCGVICHRSWGLWQAGGQGTL